MELDKVADGGEPRLFSFAGWGYCYGALSVDADDLVACVRLGLPFSK